MTKSELIELLSSFPGNPEILIEALPDDLLRYSDEDPRRICGNLYDTNRVTICCEDSPGYFHEGEWVSCPAFVVIYPDIRWWQDDVKFAEYEAEWGPDKRLRELRSKYPKGTNFYKVLGEY